MNRGSRIRKRFKRNRSDDRLHLRLATGAILAAAALLRAVGLGHDELWFDEAYAALLASGSVGSIFAELARDSSPPLYFLLLWLWEKLFGLEPTTLRMFSVVFGVFTVYLVGQLGARLWGQRVGLVASALLAISPLHIYYSREVRPYSLLLVFVLASFIALDGLVKTPRWSYRVGYCLVTLSAFYTHNYGIFLLVVLILVAATGQLAPRAALAYGAVVGFGYLPWVPQLLQQVSSGSTQWMADLWLQTPPVWALLKSLAGFCVGGAVPEYVLMERPWLPSLTPWISYALFCFLGLRALVGQRGEGTRYLASALAVLLVIPFALSFWKPIYLVGRHDVIALPLFLLICARGTTGLSRRAGVATGLLVLGLGTLSLSSEHAAPPIHGVEDKARFLSDNSHETDVVLCTGFTRNTLEYYVRIAGGRQPFYSFPTSFGEHRGWVDEVELADPTALQRDAVELTSVLARVVGSRQQLWIAHSRLLQQPNEMLMKEISGVFRQSPCPARAEDHGFTCWQARH